MAGEIIKPLAKAATGDLVTIRGRVFRQVQDPNHPEVKFLEPIDVEAHINPASILTGLGVGLLGVLFGTIAWHGLDIPAPLGGAIELVPGIKDTQLGKDINAAYERAKIMRRGGQIRRSRIVASREETEEIIEATIGDTTCRLLNREYQKARRRGDQEDANRLLSQATERECPWIGQL